MTYTKLEIHHLNIEAGDCTIISVATRDDTTAALTGVQRELWKPKKLVVIDGGDTKRRIIDVYLKQNNLFPESNKIDYLIVSHYHRDHIRGLSASSLLSNEKVKTLIDPGGYNNDGIVTKYSVNVLDDKYFSGYIDESADLRNEVGGRIVNSGDLFFSKNGKEALVLNLADGITMTCLAAGGIVWNPDGEHYDPLASLGMNGLEPNSHSMAFLLRWGAFSYFTAGDMVASVADKIAENFRPWFEQDAGMGTPVTVLKANHHGSTNVSGSGTYNSRTFLDAISPTHVVAPANFHYKLPRKEFFERALNLKSVKKILVVNDWSMLIENTDDLYPTFSQVTNTRESQKISNLFYSKTRSVIHCVSNEPKGDFSFNEDGDQLTPAGDQIWSHKTTPLDSKKKYKNAEIKFSESMAKYIKAIDPGEHSSLVKFFNEIDDGFGGLFIAAYKESGGVFLPDIGGILQKGSPVEFCKEIKEKKKAFLYIGTIGYMKKKDYINIMVCDASEDEKEKIDKMNSMVDFGKDMDPIFENFYQPSSNIRRMSRRIKAETFKDYVAGLREIIREKYKGKLLDDFEQYDPTPDELGELIFEMSKKKKKDA